MYFILWHSNHLHSYGYYNGGYYIDTPIIPSAPDYKVVESLKTKTGNDLVLQSDYFMLTCEWIRYSIPFFSHTNSEVVKFSWITEIFHCWAITVIKTFLEVFNYRYGTKKSIPLYFLDYYTYCFQSESACRYERIFNVFFTQKTTTLYFFFYKTGEIHSHICNFHAIFFLKIILSFQLYWLRYFKPLYFCQSITLRILWNTLYQWFLNFIVISLILNFESFLWPT